MEKGYVHVYTGKGKGKTTAALGLCLRASGAGLNIFIGQFMKGMEYSEIKAIREKLPNVRVEQFGGNLDCCSGPFGKEYVLNAQNGYKKSLEALTGGQYDIVILDEINCAVFYELLEVSDVLELIKQKPAHVELILTGRNADSDVIERADLVTEMKEIKHYYNEGIEGRTGIER